MREFSSDNGSQDQRDFEIHKDSIKFFIYNISVNLNHFITPSPWHLPHIVPQPESIHSVFCVKTYCVKLVFPDERLLRGRGWLALHDAKNRCQGITDLRDMLFCLFGNLIKYSELFFPWLCVVLFFFSELWVRVFSMLRFVLLSLKDWSQKTTVKYISSFHFLLKMKAILAQFNKDDIFLHCFANLMGIVCGVTLISFPCWSVLLKFRDNHKGPLDRPMWRCGKGDPMWESVFRYVRQFWNIL